MITYFKKYNTISKFPKVRIFGSFFNGVIQRKSYKIRNEILDKYHLAILRFEINERTEIVKLVWNGELGKRELMN